MADQEAETVKWYSHTRRFPIYVSRFPDGTKIPLGPFSLLELVAGVVVLLVGQQTMPLWGARLGAIYAYTVLICLVVGAVFGIRQIPMGSRNPLLFCWGLARAVTAPRRGRYRGRAVTFKPPHNISGRAVVAWPVYVSPRSSARQRTSGGRARVGYADPEHVTTSAPVSAAVAVMSRPVPVPVVLGPGLTNVQRLLAASTRGN